MSVEPSRTEWPIGKDTYGRGVRLIRSRDTSNRPVWTIWRDAANQRDETATVDGLSLDNLRLIGQIAAGRDRE